MDDRPVDALLAPLTARGGAAYLGEPVTQLEHALQAAALAEAAGASDSLVVAALLHDIGWLLGGDDHASRDAEAGWLLGGDDHASRGADHLARWLPDEVTEPVRLHVAAKRWLCATAPAYHDLLSDSSRRTLVSQGGPMDGDERARFEAGPWAQDAVALRLWDDGAKQPALVVPSLAHWRPLVDARAHSPS